MDPEHIPLTQFWPAGQAFPQVPQLEALDVSMPLLRLRFAEYFARYDGFLGRSVMGGQETR